MPKLAKIIEWTDARGDVMSVRFPKGDEGIIEWGSQLIVQNDQVAVFFRDGKPMATFKPGRYMLTTQNVPILTKFITGFVYGRGKTPFRATVYYVSTKLFRNLKWGTPNPLNFNDPGLGNIPVRSNGMFSIEIKKPEVFVNKIVGTLPIFRTGDIEEYLRALIVQGVQETLFELEKPFQEIPKYFSEIGLGVKALKQDEFIDSGLEIKDLKILSVTTTPDIQKALNKMTTETFDAMVKAKKIELELAAMKKGAGSAAEYREFRTGDAMVAMAGNPGSGGGGGGGADAATSVANLGLAMMMPQMMNNMMMQQQQQSSQSGAQAVAEPRIDPMAKLRQLKELLDAGILSQDEFNAKKQEWMKKL